MTVINKPTSFATNHKIAANIKASNATIINIATNLLENLWPGWVGDYDIGYFVVSNLTHHQCKIEMRGKKGKILNPALFASLSKS